jgi:hypothetical protein
MAGLVPAIHVFLLKRSKKDVDARDKRGHDAWRSDSISSKSALRLGVFRMPGHTRVIAGLSVRDMADTRSEHS